MLETDAAEMGRSHPRRATAASRASSTLMLISPAILSIALFLLLPVLCVFLISLTDYRLGLGRPTFVGFDNYVALTDDAQFGRSLTNTFVYVAIVTPVTVLLGLVLAIAIESRLRLRRFWRTVFFIPIASTLVAIAVAWEFIFDPSIGLINQLLTALGFERINFLGDPATALFVLAIIGIWDQLAVNVTLFVAGLAMVPRDYYDAAALDGARHPIDRALLVTVPMLGPMVVFVLVITVVRAFRVFDLVAVLTQGDPLGSTDVLLYHSFREAFQFFNVGYGSAIAIVFFIIVFGLMWLRLRMDRHARQSG